MTELPYFLPAPFDSASAWRLFGQGPLPGPAILDGAALGVQKQLILPALCRSAQGLPGLLARPELVDKVGVDYLAGVLGYEMREGVVRADGQAVAARLCLPTAKEDAGIRPDARWAAIWDRALEEVAGYHGIRPADWVRDRLNVILFRAQSAVDARVSARPAASGLDEGDVTVFDRSRAYSDYFAVDEYEMTHRRFDGKTNGRLKRAVFVAADAVTVLPYDPVRDRVLVVEQFRAGPMGRGDPRPWILEPVAGRIEPGDSPEETARKECREEANLDLGTLHKVAEYYPSTGCFTEYIYSYVGIADLPDGVAGLHGAVGEGEDIRGHLLDREEFMDRVHRGEMPDAPLLLTAYWLEANFGRLRELG